MIHLNIFNCYANAAEIYIPVVIYVSESVAFFYIKILVIVDMSIR